MDLLARIGRRSDALRQYQICKDALQRALGMEPSAETTKLFRSLKTSDTGETSNSETLSAAPAAKTEHPLPTVAVLPFENLSGPEDDYFVNGIVEDITTSLSCFHSLLVIARGSAFQYRDRDITDRQIADELGAQYLVRGTLQRAGQRVRVNVQLLDAHAGTHLWGHRIDRELEDVFVLQDEISSTIASTLAGRVEAARLAHARRAPPERLEAYDYVLRGKDHHHRYTPDDCRTCIDMFERAIERDPDYAVAYAWLACGIGQAIAFNLDDTSKLVDRSEAACERGLALDENEAECHRVLAQVQLTRRNLQRAMWHQERALFLNPNDDRSVCSMGELLAYCGKHEEAEAWVRKSMRLNPFHPERYWTHLARPLFHLGRYQETLTALEHITRLRRDDHVYCVAASASLGDAEIAKRNVAALREAFPELDPVAFARAMAYEREADRQAIVHALETLDRSA
jgi:adenylate cyclase